jgi:hypothetical protein
MERYLREIAAMRREMLAGKPELPGLCLALRDWSMGSRILQYEERRRDVLRRREGYEAGENQALIE